MVASRGRHRPLRVLIIGGGLGGLCLAQGLRQAGLTDVTVYERDPSAHSRMQGYRLRISPEGEAALRDCLPPQLQGLLSATSNRRLAPGIQPWDEHLNPLPPQLHPDPRGDSPDKVDAVDRGTLRHVLLAGLDSVVRFGCQLVRCEQSGDTVRAHFADGEVATGDVLVAADGVRSQVRAQLRPDDRLTDLNVRGVLSRTPRSAAIAAGLPERLRDQFSYVIGSDGASLGLMPMVFRSRPRAAVAAHWPGLPMDDADDYYMSVFQLHQQALGMADEVFFAMTGEDLRRLALDRTSHWHPELRPLWACAQPEETYPIALRAMTPVHRWDTGAIVPLGDAVHTMPPTGGAGANTALRDASTLSRALAAVSRGERDLTSALAEYQDQMVRYATEAVQASLRVARSFKVIESAEQAAGTA